MSCGLCHESILKIRIPRSIFPSVSFLGKEKIPKSLSPSLRLQLIQSWMMLRPSEIIDREGISLFTCQRFAPSYPASWISFSRGKISSLIKSFTFSIAFFASSESKPEPENKAGGAGPRRGDVTFEVGGWKLDPTSGLAAR